MKFKRKYPKYKKCPRCGNKCLPAQEKCEECGLIFSRLQYASNKAAKRKLRKFDRDFIIYTNQYPKDVNWFYLILCTLFLGIFGGHYYYVGKYVKGGLMSVSFVYLVFCTIFNAEMVQYLETYYLYLPIGIMALSWIVSLVYVCSKKFKVPVIVEVPDDVTEYARKNLEKVKKEMKQEKDNLKKQKKESVATEKIPEPKKDKKAKQKEVVESAESSDLKQEEPVSADLQKDKKEEK